MIGVEFTVPQYFKMNFKLCTVHNKFDAFITNISTTILSAPLQCMKRVNMLKSTAALAM